MTSKSTLILGGTRSGKSSYAVQLAGQLEGKVAFLVTASPGDKEMEDRIVRHQRSRPPGWLTIEVDDDITTAINQLDKDIRIVILDCLTIYISNLLIGSEEIDESVFANKEEDIINRIKQGLKCLFDFNGEIIIVSNEVGQGVVPPYPLGRLFRDIQGNVNKLVAQKADKVILMTAGIPISLKP